MNDREIKVYRDGQWLVLLTIRHRPDGTDRRSQMYLSLDEAAIMCELLKRELPEVTVRKADAGHQEQ